MDQKEKLGLWLIILASLFLFAGSLFIVNFANITISERKERDLNKTLDLIEVGMRDRVMTAEDLLYGLRGLVVTEGITARNWDNFLLQTELENRYPGVYSLAYVQKISKLDIEGFENDLRLSGGIKYENYTVFPISNSDVYYPVKYLYSTSNEINNLLGFDFGYSEKSTTTFTNSVLSGVPTMSELLYLDKVIPESKVSGYEIVLPVYENIDILQVPTNQKNIRPIGFVGAWITPENLRNRNINLTGLKYSIYDGDQKIFTVGSIGEQKASVSKEIKILNRKFKIVLESDSLFVLPGIEGNSSIIIIGSLLVINLLWIFTIYTIRSSRKKAISYADFITKDLRKFKQAVDGVSDHVVITNPEGVITYANKAATEITGYSLEEMLGEKPSLWGGQMPKEFYAKFWKIIKIDKRPYWGQLTNKRKDGELYISEIRVTPIIDERGKLLFFVGIERDMSKFEIIDKMKTEFISLASHQLRTPLSAAKWFGEMLADEEAGKLNQTQKKYVDKINESNEREIQLVNSLLNLSKIESGEIKINPKKTDFKKLVEEILMEEKVKLDGQKKILKYEIGKNIPEIDIDVDLIKHVYNNLLTNAGNYTNPTGTISCKVFIKDEDVVTEISDTGIGIPKAEQKRIFEKFFRGSNALKQETEGNGLGLYLSKIIVESSGGKIWFVSEEGKGSAFSFSIPIKPVSVKKPA